MRRCRSGRAEIFTEGDFDGTRAALLAALKGTGWATATVAQEAQVLPSEHAAHVSYRVEAGPRLRFGALGVSGGRAVSRDRVRAQAALEIKPG